MEHEKKYNEALERAREYKKHGYMMINAALDNIFPELAESEDEKIRKSLIDMLKNDEKCYIKEIAWLEKQGEHKSVDKTKPMFKEGDWIIFDGLILHIDEIVHGYYRTTSIGGIPNSYDWDIDSIARPWTIQEAKDGDVLALDNKIFIYAHRRGMYPIAVAHCVVDNVIGFYLGGEFRYAEKGISISPATKEQRDLLFSKMKERGYE